MPKKKPTTNTLTAEQKRELKLMDELSNKHGYLFTKMDRKADRFTTIVRGSQLVPAIMMRVAVPVDTAYGKAMRDFYDNLEKKAPKSRS